ncbi:MAG TPA: ECF transporter S component [Dehalococcoidia bacterium]|nr:ECF transporter S component [Dehalococcoidia bacterium]
MAANAITTATDSAWRRASLRWPILLVLNLVGVGTYIYPFVVAGALEPSSRWYEHRGDGPLLMAAVAALGLALLLAELTGGRLNTKSLAVLAVLATTAAALRTITLPAGANLYFFLVILGGWVFGARLGFLLGTLSFVLSAIITGGLGPWLPFQVFAAGWVGMTAGALGNLVGNLGVGSRWERVIIVVFGFAWGIAYGMIVNLWFWPFWIGGPDMTFDPAAGLVDNVRRYFNFYFLASAGWDLMRACCNAVALAALGGPLLEGLRQFHRRFGWEIR